MSWPVPREKTNGWFWGRVLSNSVPSSSFPVQCLCRTYPLRCLMGQWSTRFLTLICSFWGTATSARVRPLCSPPALLTLPVLSSAHQFPPIPFSKVQTLSGCRTAAPARGCGGRGGLPFTPHPVASCSAYPPICGYCRGSALRHPHITTRWFQGAPVLQEYTPGWLSASSPIAAPTWHPLGPAGHPDGSPVSHRLIFIC